MFNKNDFLTNYQKLQERIHNASIKCNRNPLDIRVVVVTKTHELQTIQSIIDLGIKDIGENRVQEIERKIPFLKGDFETHMIGHLQTNKVNKVVPLVNWIHSLDSLRVIQKTENAAIACGKSINALIEVKTTKEETKSGCKVEEVTELAEAISKTKCLKFCGLMTIGPLSTNEKEVRKSFIMLRKLSERCKHLASKIELSMGMSSDFEWAIEEGATIIRIGTLLLGERK
jgi:pyridoxal phosphate enzyme (YggS family)